MPDRDYILAAATAWLIGLSALLCDHFQPSLPFIIGSHVLFAVATCGAICLVLIGKARALAGTSQPELYLFTRLVSRWVYILMYALALVRVALHLYETSSARSLDDFQFYIACCVVPLWAIRAVVLAMPLKSRATSECESGSPVKTPPRERLAQYV
jgi:hypothetical protein